MSLINPSSVNAMMFGAISAVSLPIGSLIGIWTKPSRRIISAIMSFGAGALIAAIAFELVNPALGRREAGFLPLALGLVIGSVVFVLLSRALDSQGGFLRKRSTLLVRLKSSKKERVKKIVERLSRVDFMRSLPADLMTAVIPSINVHSFPKGTVVFAQDNFGDAMYIIEKGKVRIEWTDSGGGRETVAVLGPNETFGEMAILWNARRTATAIAETDVITWEILKEDFDRLMEASPEMRLAVTALAEVRKSANNLPVLPLTEREWEEKALKNMDEENYRPTEAELKIAAKGAGGGAPFAIWLGIFLDGIPESLVIGASMVGTTISPALIAGLFVANLPESLSSSTLMKQSGTPAWKIVGMWLSLVFAVAIGAFFGNLLGGILSPTAHSVFEGLAAGAMLAMAAQTMLPEAYEQNTGTVGLFTVLGFVATVFFHTLSPHA